MRNLLLTIVTSLFTCFLNAQELDVLDFKYMTINGLERNPVMHKENWQLIVDWEKETFLLLPGENENGTHEYIMMSGSFFQMTHDKPLTIISGLFAAGFEENEFEYSENGKIVFMFNPEMTVIESFYFSFNADMRYNWIFSNEPLKEAGRD